MTSFKQGSPNLSHARSPDQRGRLLPIAVAVALVACGSDPIGPPGIDERVDSAAVDQPEIDAPPVDSRSATVDFGMGPVTVSFRNQGGLAMMEGDMILGTVEEVERGDLLLPILGPGKIQPTFAGLWDGNSWPGGLVLYKLDPDIGAFASMQLEAAMDYIEANSIVRFQTTNAPSGFLDIRLIPGPGNEGNATVGYRGSQTMTLNLTANASTPLIIHELGHVIGHVHEQSRQDRDAFVEINWANIEDELEGNYQVFAGSLDFLPYDFTSIMHYPSLAAPFAIDPAVPTIVKSGCALTSTSPQCLITFPGVMSQSDLKGVTRIVAGTPSRFMLRNAGNDLCLMAAATGNFVSFTNCTDNLPTKRWYQYTRAGTNTPMIINASTRLCLTRRTSDQMLIQLQCDGVTTQQVTSQGTALKNGARCLARTLPPGTSTERAIYTSNCSSTSASQMWTKPSAN